MRKLLEKLESKKDNQGRDLGAVKRHFDRMADAAKKGRERSSGKYKEYERAGWEDPTWQMVEGVLVMRVGKDSIVAVPASGKKNARFFEIIDLDKREVLVPKLKKDEVVSWLFASWKARHGF